MITKDIQYRDGAVILNGYLAYDDTAGDLRPGILVVHEAWGLGEHAMERARMLAALGYVALAVDMYGDRRGASDIPAVTALMGPLRADPDKLRARAHAGLATLAELPMVDATRLAAIGFCFGGATVLELARAGAELRGVVSFHGALETTAPALPGGITAKILVCTGADDPMIPQEQVIVFEEEMRHAGADWQVVTYGGTVHSFTNSAASPAIFPGTAYNAQTDRRSWAAMRGFLEEVFEESRSLY